MGTPDFAACILKALAESEHEVAAVFTQPDKPVGRKRILTAPPVKKLAEEYGFRVFQPQSLKSGEDAEESVRELCKLAPDVIAVAAYGKLLPKSVLDISKLGCVNVHGSLLPRYRGASPIQSAIINGDAKTGVTTMLMAEGMDTGDILLCRETKIGENETSDSLFKRLADIGAELLIETLSGLESGEITPIRQDDSKATYAKKITKDMCAVDFSESAFSVHKKICGLSSAPCAETRLYGKRLKLYKSELTDIDSSKASFGSFLGDGFTVACKDKAVRILELQLEGSKKMSAEDFLRGRKLEKGTILGA